MKVLILVDNSNVYIEGRKLSARRKNVFRGPFDTKDPQDPSWRVDFGNLFDYLAEGRDVIAGILVGSTPPQTDSIWSAAQRSGFTVLTHERGINGGEKAIDTEIVAQGTEIICDHGIPGILVIVSGDRDFIPLVKLARRRNWRVEMCAFSSAFNPNGDMASSVDRIRELDTAFDQIGRNDFVWPI